MEDREIARGRSPRLAAGYHPEGCRIGSNVRQYCPGVRQGAGKPSMSHRRVDGRGRYGNEGRQQPEYRDEPMRREGLQARGAYKEVPSLAFGQALATPESSQAMQPSKGQNNPYKYSLLSPTLYIYFSSSLYILFSFNLSSVLYYRDLYSSRSIPILRIQIRYIPIIYSGSIILGVVCSYRALCYI